MDGRRRTAAYKKIFAPNGIRYQFFCDISGALVCTTGLQSSDDPEQAWNKEGAGSFNKCHRCGRWVSDPMYNADTLECVQCSPWEDVPIFCPQCGAKVTDSSAFCCRCHARLRYCRREECG